MVDEPKLKPCPFCGGNARLFQADYWHISCRDCGTQSGSAWTTGQAAEMWNRRAPSPLSETTTRNLACIKLHLEIAEVSKRTQALMPSIVNFKDALRRLAEVEAALAEYDAAGKEG